MFQWLGGDFDIRASQADRIGTRSCTTLCLRQQPLFLTISTLQAHSSFAAPLCPQARFHTQIEQLFLKGPGVLAIRWCRHTQTICNFNPLFQFRKLQGIILTPNNQRRDFSRKVFSTRQLPTTSSSFERALESQPRRLGFDSWGVAFQPRTTSE